jgi:hypothetical protein
MLASQPVVLDRLQGGTAGHDTELTARASQADTDPAANGARAVDADTWEYLFNHRCLQSM